MKRVFLAVIILSAIVFLGLTAYAGMAPQQFTHHVIVFNLFRLSGAGFFIGMVYLVVWLYRVGTRSGNQGPQ